MARTVRNPKLDTRSACAKLATRDSPYWVSLACAGFVTVANHSRALVWASA